VPFLNTVYTNNGKVELLFFWNDAVIVKFVYSFAAICVLQMP